MKNNISELSTLIHQLQVLEKQPIVVPEVGSVSPSEFHLITAIGENGQITAKELSLFLNISKGGISQVLNPLVKRGLVLKERSQTDRRQVYLTLAPSGLAVFKVHQTIQSEVFNAVSASLTPAEIKIFKLGLRAVTEETKKLINQREEAQRDERKNNDNWWFGPCGKDYCP